MNQRSEIDAELAACEKCREVPSYHAGLHAGHVWTNMQCPAYRTQDGRDCECADSAVLSMSTFHGTEELSDPNAEPLDDYSEAWAAIIIEPYAGGLFGSCQREGCGRKVTSQVSSGWAGCWKHACDDHAAEMAEVPSLIPCVCLAAGGCVVLHTAEQHAASRDAKSAGAR